MRTKGAHAAHPPLSDTTRSSRCQIMTPCVPGPPGGPSRVILYPLARPNPFRGVSSISPPIVGTSSFPVKTAVQSPDTARGSREEWSLLSIGRVQITPAEFGSEIPGAAGPVGRVGYSVCGGDPSGLTPLLRRGSPPGNGFSRPFSHQHSNDICGEGRIWCGSVTPVFGQVRWPIEYGPRPPCVPSGFAQRMPDRRVKRRPPVGAEVPVTDLAGLKILLR
jgi:hypothetical protein